MYSLFKQYYKYIVSTLLVLCVGMTVYVLFYKLGSFPLENWDEAWYGEVTKEMIRTKDLFVLHWDFALWLEKPPLYMWLSAFFSLFLGFNELAIRMTSALSALAVVVIVTVYAYRKYSLVPSFFTFFTLLLNNIFIWRARSGNIDLLVTLEIVLSYFLLVGSTKYKYRLLGILMAVIFLTKAALVVFPLVILLLFELVFQSKYWKKNIREYAYGMLLFVGISAIWLLVGYSEAGMQFILYYLFKSDQGESTLTGFNPHYLQYVYYSLQRRYSWFLIVGVLTALWQSKKPEYFLLVLFSCLLIVQLSFSGKNNNWYLTPAMPFWSLLIAYAVYQIIKVFRYNICIQLALLFLCLILSYKTFTTNIKPMFFSSSVEKQAQSSKKLQTLTSPHDTIIRLDHLYPTTLFYADRYMRASPAGNSRSDSYWISRDDLSQGVQNGTYHWLIGTGSEVSDFVSTFKTKQITILQVNDQEAIAHIK